MKHLKALPLAGAVAGISLLAGAWSGPKEAPHAWLASELIGMKVVSQEGESLGKIEDVVVRPAGDNSYAVLSFGGWLGMGDKLFAMPWSVLHTVEADTAKKDSARSLVLPLLKERLKTAPGFDQKSWPNFANPDWTKDIDTFYMGDVNPDTRRPVDAAAHTARPTWRATELKGTNVQTATGEKLGDLQEIAIDTNGRVSYATISVGGFLGVGDKVIAVPWDLYTFKLAGEKGDKKVVTLGLTKKQLEGAPEFKAGKDNCAEMCHPKWITRVYDYFSCPAYWSDAPAKS